MAMVLQANRVTSSNSSTVPMDAYKSLQSSNSQEDTLHRKIFEKIEESKRDRDPEKCQQILEDLMKILKHLTADVNNYNLAFRETRPPFYMQEFQRLTDSIERLTKAKDTLTEFLRELQDQRVEPAVPSSTSNPDVSSSQASPPGGPPRAIRSSPPEKPSHHHQTSSSSSSIQSTSRDIFSHDHSASNSTDANDHHATSTHPGHRPRSPSMTPSNFIRVHFPNKHTTAIAPRSDETLEAALESRALRHSVINLRAYTPVYMISRQTCQWDIPLDQVLETEIELEEKPKLDHSFETILTRRFPIFISARCVVCHHRIREVHKRCVSCGNHYHNHCYSKAPMCSQPLLQHIQHLGPDHSTNDRGTTPQTRTKEQSRSLPRFPTPRPGINTTLVTGPRKDSSQETSPGHPPATTSNVGTFLNALPSTMHISASLSSNSLYQPASSIISSSLPSAAIPIHHHIPQLLLSKILFRTS